MAVIGMEPEFDRRYFDEDAIDLCKSTWVGLEPLVLSPPTDTAMSDGRSIDSIDPSIASHLPTSLTTTAHPLSYPL